MTKLSWILLPLFKFLHLCHPCICFSSFHSHSSVLRETHVTLETDSSLQIPRFSIINSKSKEFFINHHTCISGSHVASGNQLLPIFVLRELDVIDNDDDNDDDDVTSLFPWVSATRWVIHLESDFLPIFLHGLLQQHKYFYIM